MPDTPTPDPLRLAAWLAAPAARDPRTGLWWSWRNPAHPGYPYEEATAWVVLLAARLRGTAAGAVLAGPAADGALVLEAIALAAGGLGRGGRRYLFDTAVGLAALDAWGGADAARDRLFATLEAFLAERRAVDGGPVAGTETAATAWSEAWGSHLLWLNVVLQPRQATALAADLTTGLLQTCTRADGALRIHPASDRAYAHATAYAATGLHAHGGLGERALADGAAAVLCRAQRSNSLAPERGWVPAWLDGTAACPARCDVTAQAAALWTGGWPQARAAALAALAGAMTGDGGVRYQPDSADANTWATVFALDAVAGAGLTRPQVKATAPDLAPARPPRAPPAGPPRALPRPGSRSARGGG